MMLQPVLDTIATIPICGHCTAVAAVAAVDDATAIAAPAIINASIFTFWSELKQ